MSTNDANDEVDGLLADLRARELQFRAVFDSALDAMLIADDAGRYLDANPAALALLRVEREVLLRLRIHDLAPLESSSQLEASWQALLRDGRQEGEIELMRVDGTSVLCEFRATADILPGRHLSVLRDVTERRKSEETRAHLERQLTLADRMASVGTLAAGVVHEINNPLTAIVTNIDLLAEDMDALAQRAQACETEILLPAPDGGTQSIAVWLTEMGEALDDARAGAEQVRRVVRDLKVFSRPDEKESGPVEVVRLLESSLRMTANEIRHHARVDTRYGSMPLVQGSESRLAQVFMNLLINAAQSIREGQADRNLIRIVTCTDERGWAVIEVHDTGAGIAPAHLPHLFEPFFTTKPVDVGTGLGLSICQRIVHEMGGEISVRSEPGRGSVFTVVLPPSRSHSISGRPLSRLSMPVRRGRLLVVDDDTLVVHAVRSTLHRQHEVVGTTRAQEALDRLLAGERFDLILCDVMMPEMTGLELYEQIVRVAPEQAPRVVFMTAGAFAADALTALPHPLLEKPFNLRQLRALMNERVQA